MNKRERVIAAINGEPVDKVPASFSLHFNKDKAFGEEGIKSHLEFFQRTNTDILKIMNENLLPYMGEIRKPQDWRNIKTISLKDDFMQAQIDFVKRILDKCDNTAFTVGTIHGITASAIHPIEAIYGYEATRELLCQHIREDKAPVMDAIKRITDGLCQLAQKYIELGLDGVYYASLGGEKRYFTNEEFEECIAPFDKMVLSAVKEKNAYNCLHICKNDLNMQRYASYKDFADIVNWGIYETNYSLEEGRNLFDGVTIMGGLANRSGVLVDATDDELVQAVKSLISSFGKTKFILGADCTLPTEISYERILTAVNAVK